ncbi:MAG: hypothetical protein Q9165_008213 [Trypethelium subeluteriae]
MATEKFDSGGDMSDIRSTKRVKLRNDSDDAYPYTLKQMQDVAHAFHKPFEDPEGNMEKLIGKVNAAASNKLVRVAKLFLVVQGTGGGKSRLLDEFSKNYITATCQLGSGSIFPPPDVEAAEFFRGRYQNEPLKGFRKEGQASRHAVCIAFIYALMVQFRIFDGPLHRVAYHLAQSKVVTGELFTAADNLTSIASPARVHVHFDGIVQLVEDNQFENLEGDMKEESKLLESGQQYRALQRIIAELSNYNLVWIVSTMNMHLGSLALGGVKEDDDLRKCDRDGSGMIPLIQTKSMIPTVQRLRPSELKIERYSESILCDMDVLKTIGRRLWSSYEDPFRYCKDRAKGIFFRITTDSGAALALLGHRIPLWTNDMEKGWVNEMHNALKDYMHLLDSREFDTHGSVVLISQPEPILTMAACAILNEGQNWRSVFRAYTRKCAIANITTQVNKANKSLRSSFVALLTLRTVTHIHRTFHGTVPLL